MSRWFDEVRLSRHPISEIGIAFYIREILRNDCVVNKWDLRDTFGMDFETRLESLRKAGMLVVEELGSQVKLTIVAPGDKKRERTRLIKQRNRKNLKGIK